MQDIALDCLALPYEGSRPRNWGQEFGRADHLVVEIGCGHGDFLLRMAEEHPDQDFIGIEQEWERVKKTLRKITLRRRALRNPTAGRNIRVLYLDAVVVLQRFFSPQTIQKVYCLFPCPWPKKRHVKHRLFSSEFLKLLNSRLLPQGEVQIATDDQEYFAWVGEQLPGTGFRYRAGRVPPRFQTKYERKWLAGGQEEFFEYQLVKEQHMPVPGEEDAPMKIYLAKNFCWEKFVWQDVHGPATVILKESLFDQQQQKVMLRFVVSEPMMTQPLWVTIGRGAKEWRIAKSFGHPIIPTPGIAAAILAVAEAAAKSGGSEFWATDEGAAVPEE